MHEPASDRRLLRFDRIERLAHWALALLFAILMLTAVPLYVGSVAQLVGRRALLAEIHSWCGVVLPVPLPTRRLVNTDLAAWLRPDAKCERSPYPQSDPR